MADFLTLVQQLQREVGVQGSPLTTVSSQTGIYAKLVNWIADADEHIKGMRTDWKFLWSQYSISTIIGTAQPSIPSDLNLWDEDSFYLDYSLASNRHLKILDYKNWRDGRGRGVLTNRKPDRVVIDPGNQIILANPPDAAYALTAEYWKKSTKMASNTDVSEIPANFHRVILLQAKMWYAEQQEIPDVYQSANFELNGSPDNKKDMGLLERLKASQLPNQHRRTMGEATQITVRAE